MFRQVDELVSSIEAEIAQREQAGDGSDAAAAAAAPPSRVAAAPDVSSVLDALDEQGDVFWQLVPPILQACHNASWIVMSCSGSSCRRPSRRGASPLARLSCAGAVVPRRELSQGVVTIQRGAAGVTVFQMCLCDVASGCCRATRRSRAPTSSASTSSPSSHM